MGIELTKTEEKGLWWVIESIIKKEGGWYLIDEIHLSGSNREHRKWPVSAKTLQSLSQKGLIQVWTNSISVWSGSSPYDWKAKKFKEYYNPIDNTYTAIRLTILAHDWAQGKE